MWKSMCLLWKGEEDTSKRIEEAGWGKLFKKFLHTVKTVSFMLENSFYLKAQLLVGLKSKWWKIGSLKTIRIMSFVWIQVFYLAQWILGGKSGRETITLLQQFQTMYWLPTTARDYACHRFLFCRNCSQANDASLCKLLHKLLSVFFFCQFLSAVPR